MGNNSAADCWNQMVVKPMKVPGDGCEGTKVTTENVAATTHPKDLQFLSLGFQNRFCYSHHQSFSNPKDICPTTTTTTTTHGIFCPHGPFFCHLTFFWLFFKSLNLASLVVNLWGKGKAEARRSRRRRRRSSRWNSLGPTQSPFLSFLCLIQTNPFYRGKVFATVFNIVLFLFGLYSL